jgi:Zn-finger nucleic acid-binding protein
MNCPRDGATLETKAFGASCPTCHGMFFEHGQLNALEPTAGDLEFSTVDGDDFQHADKYGSIACPRDGATMAKVDFNIETEIILDYCRQCGGFWLDEDELAAVHEEVNRLNEAEEEVPDPLLVRISQFFWNFPLPH